MCAKKGTYQIYKQARGADSNLEFSKMEDSDAVQKHVDLTLNVIPIFYNLM